jgi:hypothetical protein
MARSGVGPTENIMMQQGGNIMSHRLMYIAALATVASSAIALSAPTAFGQAPAKYDWNSRWHGTATCTVTGHSPSHSDYTNQETHHWEILPIVYFVDDKLGLRTWYWASWTVTGSGRFGHFSWTTNGGYGWDVLQFWVPSLADPGIGNTMNIEDDGGVFDPYGTTVTNEVDGTLSKARVDEIPFPTIVATPTKFERAPKFGDALKGSNYIVQGSSSTTINGIIFSNNEFTDERIKEPVDGINVVTCSWDFEHSPLLMKPWPGNLCLPNMPDCDKPFVLKAPLKKPD